jgi:quercetin dioxygenase-like cupin family protein
MANTGDKIVNARTGQRMIFTKTTAETNGTQLEIECFSPPTNAKEPEHIHPYQENRFRIISGQLSFSINGKLQIAYPGQTISIPKNTAHCFWNSGDAEAHYMQDFFPALKIDELFETFFALARDGQLSRNGKPNILRASVIMLAHEKEIRLANPSWLLQKCVFTLLAPIGKILGYRSKYE